MASGVVSRNENIAWNLIEGKAVLLDRDEGRAIILNEVGSHIWLILQQDRQRSDVVVSVMEHFKVEEKTANQDVENFLDEMARRDLLRIKE